MLNEIVLYHWVLLSILPSFFTVVRFYSLIHALLTHLFQHGGVPSLPHALTLVKPSASPLLGSVTHLTFSRHWPATCHACNDHGYSAGAASINKSQSFECVTNSSCFHPPRNHTARRTWLISRMPMLSRAPFCDPVKLSVNTQSYRRRTRTVTAHISTLQLQKSNRCKEGKSYNVTTNWKCV